MKKSALTFAEVLITLVIIGVIAALTVPTLIQNTQKQEYVTALKKAYSTLSQATQAIIAEECSPKGEESWFSDNISLYNMYKGYLNNAKECSTAAGCNNQLDNGMYKYLGGSTWAKGEAGSFQKLVLADGMQIIFERNIYMSNTCNQNVSGSKDVCAWIYVDVNGEKKPNIIGRDLFGFVLKENGLYPRGCDDDSFCGKCNANGWGCACKVLREGAMNY